ncbi:MAG: competence/damage-inducible protein A, partial [Bradymonadaceae bacterium]
MRIAAIAIGDELLDGRIRDRNIPALGRFLDERSLQLIHARVVPDEKPAIGDAFEETTDRADLVVATGGLGPTGDDRTRAAAAEWAGRELELDEPTLERLERRFEEHGYTFTPNNRRQCYFPTGAEILASEVGTAPGFVLERNDAETLFLPGVPREFEWFLDHHLGPRLRDVAVPASASVHLGFLGLGESGVETRVRAAKELAD